MLRTVSRGHPSGGPFAELSDRKHKNASRILMNVSGHVWNSTVYDAVLHNSRVLQLSSEIDFIMTLYAVMASIL